ncbi:hypothetical protein HDU86_006764 [Geranomyces michiganensis]|nr:hypothetical protein HDU86_006764 [Geranomyces michiganensis]
MLKHWAPIQWTNIVFDGCSIVGALIGLAGLIKNSPLLLKIFARVELAAMWFNIARALAFAVALGVGRSTLVTYCQQRNPLTAGDCDTAITITMISLAVVSIIGALFAYYYYHMISAYAARLADGSGARRDSNSGLPYTVLDESSVKQPEPSPEWSHLRPSSYHDDHKQPGHLGPDYAYTPRDAKSFDSVRLSSDEPREGGDLSSPERLRREHS